MSDLKNSTKKLRTLSSQTLKANLSKSFRYFLFSTLKEGKKIMRHSMRDYLKTDDIKLAMEKLSIPVNFVLTHCPRICLATLRAFLILTKECLSSKIYGTFSLKYFSWTLIDLKVNQPQRLCSRPEA